MNRSDVLVTVALPDEDYRQLRDIAERNGIGVARLLALHAHKSLQAPVPAVTKRSREVVNRRRTPLTEVEVEQLTRLTLENKPATEVGRILGIHALTVARYRKMIGLVHTGPRTAGEWHLPTEKAS